MATTRVLAAAISVVQRHPWIFIPLIVFARLLSNRGFSHDDDLELHRKYGKVVRIAPNTLSISDPHEINQVYGINTKFFKSRFYELSALYDDEGLVPDPFVLTDKELHSRMKRNAANAYSMNGLIQVEPWLGGPTKRLLDILDEHAQSGKSCDLGELLRHYAMDAVFSITFGKDMDFMRNGGHGGMLRTIEIFTDYMAIFGQVPWTHRFLLGNARVASWILGRNAASQDSIIQLAASQTAAYRQRAEEGLSRSPNTTPSEPTTFLHRLLLNQRANPAALTDREVATHALGNISAGSDTTATALRAVFAQLLAHPAALSRLRAELDDSSSSKQHSNAQRAPYLHAVVREALRLHPPVGLLLARTVPSPGATICGVRVPARTDVGVSPWVVHRDAAAFAPDPHAFRPERWLTADADALKAMSRAFFAFGAGAHTCSGRWISWMELVKVVPAVLGAFEVAFADGKGAGVRFRNRWFTAQRGLEVVVRRRRREGR